MKKLITGILATAIGLSCLVGCGEKPSADGVNSARDYLNEMYRKQNVEVRDDYEVLSQLMFDEQTYTITWTTDVSTVQIVERDGKTFVDVDPEATENVNYKLTATLTDAHGNTAQVTFDRVVKKAPSMVNAPISSSPVEGTEYKLYMYQSSKKQDLYFKGVMDGYYGATTQEFEEGVNVFVEYAEGSTTEFYLYFNGENDAKTYISVVVSGTHINFDIEQPTATTKFVYSNDYKAIITVDSFEKDGKTEPCYLGTYGSYSTFGPSQVSKAADSYVGTLVGMIDRDLVTPEFKVAQEKKVLAPVAAAYIGTASVELPTQGLTFSDVAITYAVTGTGAAIEGNTLTFTAGAATSDVTLTATLTAGDKSETATFPVKVVPNDTAAILAAGKAIGKGAKFGNEATLTGVVTSIDTAFNEQYGNVTVTIKVGEESVQCYRLVGTQTVLAGDIAVSDEITVTGTLENYNNKVQFGAGAKATARTAGTGTLPGGNQGGTSTPVNGLPVEGTNYVLKAASSYFAGVSNKTGSLATTAASAALVRFEAVSGTTDQFYIKVSTDNGTTWGYLTMDANSTKALVLVEKTAATTWTVNVTNKQIINTTHNTRALALYVSNGTPNSLRTYATFNSQTQAPADYDWFWFETLA